MSYKPIQNREYATALVSFDNMGFGRKRFPTDIDGFIEFDDKVFLIAETKYENSEMPFGQRLALERLVDAIEFDENKHALLVIASHGDETTIDLASCRVTECRTGGKWYTVGAENVKELFTRFKEKWERSNGNGT